MPDLGTRFYAVHGHDGVVHALDSNGYCLCNMGRATDKGLPYGAYTGLPVGCLLCLAQSDVRSHFVTLVLCV